MRTVVAVKTHAAAPTVIGAAPNRCDFIKKLRRVPAGGSLRKLPRRESEITSSDNNGDSDGGDNGDSVSGNGNDAHNNRPA